MEMAIYSLLSNQTQVCALHSFVAHAFSCKGEQINVDLTPIK